MQNMPLDRLGLMHHILHIHALLLGNIVAFVVAIIAIKFFIGFLQKHGFKLFGYYRIIASLVLFFLIWKGIIQ